MMLTLLTKVLFLLIVLKDVKVKMLNYLALQDKESKMEELFMVNGKLITVEVCLKTQLELERIY
jgi:hypothetical protein